MSARAVIHATAGDTGRVVGVRLDVDGQPVDLTGAQSIEAHMTDVTVPGSPTVTVIEHLVGDAGGNVTTVLPTLVEGRYTLEWQVTTSSGDIATYPDQGTSRPQIFVRPQADEPLED